MSSPLGTGTGAARPHWPADPPPTWRAEWIAPATLAPDTPNAAFLATTTWQVDAVPAASLLHIAAEVRYRLYVNGSLVGVGPARGTRTVTFFDSYDVAPLIRAGTNEVTVEVHSPNLFTFRASPVRAALLVQLDDGASVCTDQTWLTHVPAGWRRDVPIFTFQAGYMEWHESGAVPADGWAPAAVVSGDLGTKRLAARDVPPLRERHCAPVQVTHVAALQPLADPGSGDVAALMHSEPHDELDIVPDFVPLSLTDGGPVVVDPARHSADLVVVLDFGCEVNGGVELDIDAPAGVTVDIGYAEHAGGTHVADQRRVATVVGGYLFADRYRTGAGRQVVTTRYAERGFRFLQVALRGMTGAVALHRITGVDRRYPYVHRGRFSCDDAMLNAVWHTCVETLSACATDAFVDNPWRENTFYLNDMLVENVVALQAFGDPRLSARCLRLALSQADAGGLIAAAVPNGVQRGMPLGRADDYMTFPATNLYLAEIVTDYLLHSGDTALAAELTTHLVRILDTVAQWEDDRGLITPPDKHWAFIDWSFENAGHSLTGRTAAATNLFYVRALAGAAALAEMTGVETDRCTGWRAKAARTARAIQETFWDDAAGCYREWVGDDAPAAQLTQALACLTDDTIDLTTVDSRAARTRAAVIDDTLLRPELFMHHYVLRALAAMGRTSEALATVRRYWGPIVAQGAPTIWECGVDQHGAAAFNGAGSLCHGFATTPVSLLQRTVLGVRPTAPGFSRFTLAPRLGDLREASGSVPTPAGDITVHWSRTDAGVSGEVTVPRGLVAELPDGTTLPPGRHELSLQRN